MALSLASQESPDSSGRLAAYLNLNGTSDSVVNRIVIEVARDVIEGRVAPGQSVNSLDLAKRFATSRTPIREALITLGRGGLLEIEPRKRPRVSALSDEQIDEIYDLRSELNSLIAVKVVARITPEGLARLESSLAVMRAATEAADVDSYFWGNVDYHQECEEIAGDGTIRRVQASLGLQVLRLRHEGMSAPGQLARSMADHERLHLAFAERDAVLAAALSRSLVRNGLRAIRQVNASLEH